MFHEIGGQPVEDILMERRGRAAAKVGQVRYEWLAEVTGPDMVHQHARGQRVFRVRYPARQRQTASRAGGWVRFRAVGCGFVGAFERFQARAK